MFQLPPPNFKDEKIFLRWRIWSKNKFIICLKSIIYILTSRLKYNLIKLNILEGGVGTKMKFYALKNI